MPDGSTGEEMVIGFDASRNRRLLIVAPLFDEANKFRHQLSEIMRRLHAQGIDCFLPDLPGCNESMAPFADQSLAHWRACVTAAAANFSATDIFAIRSGCWLVPEDESGWLYAPAKPQQVLRSMIRARMLSAKEAGREETADRLMETARADGIELAGWPLGPQLVAELEGEQFDAPDEYIVIEQGEVGGKPLWLRAENDSDPGQADSIVSLIASGEESA